MEPDLQTKLHQLRALFKTMSGAVIAFSGGVDSSLLTHVAHEVLGARALAVTAVSDIQKQSEQKTAQRIAREIGVRHVLLATNEMDDKDFTANTQKRCYFCKASLLKALGALAREQGLEAVVEGANQDDLGDYRPGLMAAKEFGARQPLLELKITKTEVRQMAQHLGLSNWDKPAAPCLASRIPYDTPVTRERLRKIAQGEELLSNLGLSVFRLRHHETIARIEIPVGDFEQLLANRKQLVVGLKRLGYLYVTLDLQGFCSGSMNQGLREPLVSVNKRCS